ncbi:MAG: protein-export membrane protein SecD [Planctomycetes bacterium RBG_13_62_9]|nr:MAG: protein-export membrane protein SecD [Planctomycetes bacterium RBG_13_62_9]
MSRNLLPKFVLILVLVLLAGLALYPPSMTLKPGIDLAGGTSLIYAIDTQGLAADQEKDLAQKMITVLRHRIDPANIQNLLWRPLGNTRFEIQMPLASKETQEKKDQYLAAINDLLDKNINPATIMRALKLPVEERQAQFVQFSQNDPNRLKILDDLASAHDNREKLQQTRDTLSQEIPTLEEKMKAAGLDLGRIQANRHLWVTQSDETLKKTLTDFLGSDQQLELLTGYVKMYAEYADAANKLTAAAGLNEKYEEAKRPLDRLNLSREQIEYVLELDPKSADRAKQLQRLTTTYPHRTGEIARVVAAYDEYRPFRGRLDDPADLRRMLKGAGILEFRILPTMDRSDLSAAEIQRYQESLAEKGPTAASDSQYVWVEIEKFDEWHVGTQIVGQFGDKNYVLAAGDSRPDEAMLHRPGSREWKLENAYPTTDQIGRRAIGFALDIRGGDLFYNVTGKNGGRPLAIILDDTAISAPSIQPDRPIRDKGVIEGSFTPTQVSDMVDKLNAGSLPARLIEQPISERVIGPSIGADNRDKGIRSGIIGVILVVAFMMCYYFVGGAIANAALMLNILFTLAIMATLRATFTLPGIAGLILTIGMSVDANVLIFERIREEQEKGMGLATAIKNGYQRAFSAIFDSNLTTILTAAILYYVASEDVKGFAIVLMLGIGSSMFTAIFVTRVILDFLVSKRIVKNHLGMLRLIQVPNVNWMRLRPVFFTISAVLVFGGLILFFLRDKSKYDIEFTGGTSVQIDFKSGVSLTRQDVEDRIVQIGEKLNNADLKSANVYSVGEPIGQAANGEKIYDQYEITTTATNKLLTTVTFADGGQSVDSVGAAIRKAEADQRRELGGFKVTSAGDKAFVVATSRVNPAMVQDVLKTAFPQDQVSESQAEELVADAIKQAFEGQLQVQQNLQPTIASAEKITDQTVETYPEIAEYIGGIKIETTLGAPATMKEIDNRLKDLKFRPDTQDLLAYPYAVYGPGFKPVEPNQAVAAFTFVSVQPEAGLRDLSEQEWTQFVDNEKARVLQATERETSLSRVTQIDPFVGSEQKTRAIISVVLSLAAIVAYIWLRFGSLRFGLAAIIALFHDVSTALGAIAISAFLATTIFGQALLIGDFRINSTVVAAVLTLLGYSLNDTIVVFDRIRENRRKVQLTPQTVSNSINQTLSRTVITGITTFMVVFVMYVFGGSGLRGFNFVIFLGLLVGTYSSIAIAAPLLLVGLPREQTKSRPAVKIEGMPIRAKAEGAA